MKNAQKAIDLAVRHYGADKPKVLISALIASGIVREKLSYPYRPEWDSLELGIKAGKGIS